jgi:uncharacterized 2Fe-2S/4Fe-4S cluster protein (DUF4445 family)
VTYQIEFEPIGRRGPCPEKGSLLDCARQLGIGLASICGGQGTCKACKVQVLKGRVSALSSTETEFFSNEQQKSGWRLACRTYPQSDVSIYIPPESMTTIQRTQVESINIPIIPDPIVKNYPVKLEKPSLTDLESDFTRLSKALLQQNVICNKIDIEALRNISPQLRGWNWEALVSMKDTEIISISPPSSPTLGLAVDLGTTKIACYLMDIKTGNTLASKGIMNPQISYGEDITSRMLYAMKSKEHNHQLQNLVVSVIDQTAIDLCSQIQAKPSDILDMVIVGNTAMHHLLLGLPVAQLANSPFIAAVQEAVDIKARDIGSKLNPGAWLHVLPNVAGYVGADHISMLLAIDCENIDKNTIAIDIGTNTEVSLISKGKIWAASCASGPAFEGGQISMGMRAASGAIERLRIQDDKIDYQTIDNAPPVGICGSGVIDTLAQLYISGILGKNGRIKPDHSLVRKNGDTLEVVLVERSNDHPAITFNQHDIRELQLAKAAIHSGIQILLETAGLTESDIDQVLIAGAFGTYIDVSSAITIGMLPAIPLNRFTQVGNAAGLGAKIALLSNIKRQQAQKIASKVHYVELATNLNFMQTFLKSTFLGSRQ